MALMGVQEEEVAHLEHSADQHGPDLLCPAWIQPC